MTCRASTARVSACASAIWVMRPTSGVLEARSASVKPRGTVLSFLAVKEPWHWYVTSSA